MQTDETLKDHAERIRFLETSLERLAVSFANLCVHILEETNNKKSQLKETNNG